MTILSEPVYARSLPLSLLVFEPADITWRGVQQFMQEAGFPPSNIWRVEHADNIIPMANRLQPDILMITPASYGEQLLVLLQQLSYINNTYRSYKVIVYLKQDIPYLDNLLKLYGVTDVVKTLGDAQGFYHYLSVITLLPPRTNGCLTTEERKVMHKLLIGTNVTDISHQLGKNIRTVSAQKKAIVKKMKMTSSGELQVLCGNLMPPESWS